MKWKESRKCFHQKRHFPGGFPVTTSLCGLHDSSDPDTQKMRSRIHICNKQDKDQPPSLHGRSEALC